MKHLLTPIALALLTACQSSETPSYTPDFLQLDVEEMDVCDFHVSKVVWMRRDQDILSVAGTSLWSMQTDIVLPVRLTFVGKVDVADGIRLQHQSDGSCIATVTTMTRMTSAVPDYGEMQRLTRTDWYNTTEIGDEIVTRLVDAAIDTVLTRNHERMLSVTDQHASTLLMPLLTTQLQLTPSQLTIQFYHK